MNISTDNIIIWQGETIVLNATLAFTWLIMGLLVVISWLVSRTLSAATQPTRGQTILEVLTAGISEQIREISDQDPTPYLPFVGTLFIFIATANLLAIVPGYEPPTGSLSTTA